jgi:hypothetical protein
MQGNLITSAIILSPSPSHFLFELPPQPSKSSDDDDVYLDKLQTRGVEKSILYMRNVDYSQ